MVNSAAALQAVRNDPTRHPCRARPAAAALERVPAQEPAAALGVGGARDVAMRAALDVAAGVTVDSRDAMAQWNAEQLVQIFRGERPPRLINPEAWTKFAQRFERTFGFRPASPSSPPMIAGSAH